MDIQEIPLDIAEEVQAIAGNLAEIKADEEPEPPQDAPASEEVKTAIKPKAKSRPKGALNRAPSKPRPKRLKCKRHLWKKLHTNPPLQSGS